MSNESTASLAAVHTVCGQPPGIGSASSTTGLGGKNQPIKARSLLFAVHGKCFQGLGGKHQPIKAKSLLFAAHGKCFQVSTAHKPAGASSFLFKVSTAYKQASTSSFFLKELFCVGSVPGFIDVLEFQDYSEASLKPHVPADTAEEVVVMLYTSGTTGLPKAVQISHKAYVSSYHVLMLREIVNEARTNNHPAVGLKKIIVGGTMITESVGTDLCEFFGANSLVIFYGLTETFPIVSGTPPGKICMDNVGVPCAGTKVKILDLFSGDSLGPYQKGEIVVQSRTLMKGYYGRPEATQEVLSSDGWFRTGDLGYYDNDGQIYFVDRIKQMIKCMGNIVTPAELEEILTSHEAVLEAAVVGIPSSKYGEAPVACVVVKETQEECLESLEQELKELVAGEIVVQSRTLMKGYYGRPEATQEVLSSDGWFRTGDLGYYDNDGQIYFVDRIKQMIKCMGNIVTPAELEEILTSHEAVLEAAVVGIPSSKYGEAPVACVVVKETQEECLESLEQELKELVAVLLCSELYCVSCGGFVQALWAATLATELASLPSVSCNILQALGYSCS
ncbi:4-coumarate--CoA ligase 5-like [Ixodes scapularis]